MTTEKKPRGYITRVLFADCETSGLAYNADDPSYDPVTGKEYQAVSWGLVVADAQTLNKIDELYVEIKWNGTAAWSKEAEKIHGLSLAYLEENGLEEEEAVAEIGGLILKHWGPSSPVCLGGHNVATFDKKFLQRLLRKYDLEVPFGSKTIDTNAVGFATFGTHNSDDLFSAVGLAERKEHNALVDANNARISVQRIRKMFNACMEGA